MASGWPLFSFPFGDDLPAWPAKVLVVSKDPAPTEYGTIQAAIDAGAALGPTTANPVLVLVAPGTYPENLTLRSHVYLAVFDGGAGTAAASTRGVTISGNLSYLPTAATDERHVMMGFQVTGTTTVDTTGKTGGFCLLAWSSLNLTGAATLTGRVGGSDTFRASSVRFAGAVTSTEFTLVYVTGETSGLTTVNGTAPKGLTARGGSTFQAVTVNGTCQFNHPSGTGTTLTVAGTATADVRGARWASFVGPGPINRDVINGNSGATAIGANAVAFAVPLLDANYNVMLTQASGVALAAKANGKTATGFNLDALGAGDTYDYTVVHD